MLSLTSAVLTSLVAVLLVVVVLLVVLLLLLPTQDWPTPQIVTRSLLYRHHTTIDLR